ncbi:hypothetical protein [Proteiniborus sp.]
MRETISKIIRDEHVWKNCYFMIIGKRTAFELDTESMKLLKLISCQ